LPGAWSDAVCQVHGRWLVARGCAADSAKPSRTIVEWRWWHHGRAPWSPFVLHQLRQCRDMGTPRFAYDPEVTLPSAPPPIRPCYYTNMTANRCLGLRRSGLPTDIVPVADYLSSYE
jgi:hypothetical protein